MNRSVLGFAVVVVALAGFFLVALGGQQQHVLGVLGFGSLLVVPFLPLARWATKAATLFEGAAGTSFVAASVTPAASSAAAAALAAAAMPAAAMPSVPPRLRLVKPAPAVASVVAGAGAGVGAAAGRRAGPGPWLFARGVGAGEGLGDEQLGRLGQLLVDTLASYDVEAHLEESFAGSSFATFEITLGAGTKMSKVLGLEGDLSMCFGRKVRIGVGSKPGRLGVEVGLEVRGRVGIRELLEDPGFARAGALPLCLGSDARGRPVYADLTAMPHLLVAGSTGSGKSVALSAELCSLLVARAPSELRLLLVDPKGIELLPFAEAPHCDRIVSDASGAIEVLEGAAAEMEHRYGLLAAAGCKNLDAYNKKASASASLTALPRIVIVVDEYADLKMSEHGKAIEELVCRLAQKSRAAGIHLVLATQRPSVDVISGSVKANFPARIAFRVGDAASSRTVLDAQGAEQLLGKGDCLCRLEGSDEVSRVQCPMVSDEEIEALVGCWSAS